MSKNIYYPSYLLAQKFIDESTEVEGKILKDCYSDHAINNLVFKDKVGDRKKYTLRSLLIEVFGKKFAADTPKQDEQNSDDKGKAAVTPKPDKKVYGKSKAVDEGESK